MKFKTAMVSLALCLFSGLTMAAAPEASGAEAGKAAAAAPMSSAMQDMVSQKCSEHSRARGDDGRELGCVKGAWQVSASAKGKQSKARRAVCVFRCSVSHGIEVCRGNGPQCNGVSPW